MLALLAVPVALASNPVPATALEHDLDVAYDTRGRATVEVRWVVRIDDPAGCVGGLAAPPDLDGAEDHGALVVERLLLCPEDTAPGTVFNLATTRRHPAAASAGLLAAAPDMRTDRTHLAVRAPLGTPLSVWADPAGALASSTRGVRAVEITWGPTDGTARAAWSAQEGWNDDAAAFHRMVEAKLGVATDLPTDLVDAARHAELGDLLRRVQARIPLDPGRPEGWDDARRASAIDAEGSAAERGVVLLSLLRLGGIRAWPAWARSASAPGELVLTVPTPHALTRPVVVADGPDGRVILDPASPFTDVRQIPAALIGGWFWLPGELPEPLAARGVVDGVVRISSTVELEPDGQARWHAWIEPSGAAAEHLRTLLGPLDEAGRRAALGGLAQWARPDRSEIEVDLQHVDQVDQTLRLAVSGRDAPLSTTAWGLRGTVRPILVAALAAWLPPDVEVTEALRITAPGAVRVLTARPPDPLVTSEVVLTWVVDHTGPVVTVHARAVRPYRRTTVATEARAAAQLRDEAQRGVDLGLFAHPSPATFDALGADPSLSPADRAVLQALMTRGRGRRARHALARGIEQAGQAAVIDAMVGWGGADNVRPWTPLLRLADDDLQRAAVMTGLLRAGARQAAADRAEGLLRSPDGEVRAAALRVLEATQGPRPDPVLDPAAAGRWRDPAVVLADATAAWGHATGPADLATALADLAVRVGDLGQAEAFLASAGTGPWARVVRASVAAGRGGPADRVRAEVADAVAEAPTDVAVRRAAARALAQAAEGRGALEHAGLAAWLAGDDAGLWVMASERALVAGDMAQAIQAARRASDAAPELATLAHRWSELALAAGDRDHIDASAARRHEGAAPTRSLSDRVASMPEASLAVLDAASPEVLADPDALAARARLRLTAGRRLDAAEDGVRLATDHDRADGWSLAYAAMAGLQVSTTLDQGLDRATQIDPSAVLTRMEHRMVAGQADPLVDARRLGADSRGDALVQAVLRPNAAAERIDGWPARLPAHEVAGPVGWSPNRVLSAHDAVTGFSNRTEGLAVLYVGASVAALPPPLGVLYTAGPQPLKSDGDALVYALRGGALPLYAATAALDGERVWGLAFTPEGALRALDSGLRARP